jgi:hypothetical protein
MNASPPPLANSALEAPVPEALDETASVLATQDLTRKTRPNRLASHQNNWQPLGSIRDYLTEHMRHDNQW